MKIEPIKQIEQLNYKKKATSWEEVEQWDWNDPVKTNGKSIIPPEEYRPDDNGCTRKDITKSGETLDIII